MTALISSAPFDTRKLQTLIVKGHAQTIGKDALNGCAMPESLTIENGVKSIEQGAFRMRMCENLKALTIADSVSAIGFGAFEGCTPLRSVVLPGSLKTLKASTLMPTNPCKTRVYWRCIQIRKPFRRGRRDLSPYTIRHTNLKRAFLPIPAQPHM